MWQVGWCDPIILTINCSLILKDSAQLMQSKGAFLKRPLLQPLNLGLIPLTLSKFHLWKKPDYPVYPRLNFLAKLSWVQSEDQTHEMRRRDLKHNRLDAICGFYQLDASASLGFIKPVSSIMLLQVRWLHQVASSLWKYFNMTVARLWWSFSYLK